MLRWKPAAAALFLLLPVLAAGCFPEKRGGQDADRPAEGVLPDPDEFSLLDRSGRPAYEPGVVIVRFRRGASRSAIHRAVRTAGADLETRLEELDCSRLRLRGGVTVRQAVLALRKDPAVAWAEPVYFCYPCSGPAPGSPGSKPVPADG